MQFSLFSHEQNNDERYTGNLGFGKRILSDDKTLITGFNTFLDHDDDSSHDNDRHINIFNPNPTTLALVGLG